MMALIATAAHRPTACGTGSSDSHHANTEHHYCVVVDQRHKVVKRLRPGERSDVAIASGRCYLG